jgi:hypothetical protein
MNGEYTEYCHLCHEGEVVTSDGVCSRCAAKYPTPKRVTERDQLCACRAANKELVEALENILDSYVWQMYAATKNPHATKSVIDAKAALAKWREG